MSANDLLGLTTDCGWEIFEKISTKQHSGGNFCVRYLVRDSSGNVAFLKAMDLSRAFQFQDRLKAMNDLTSHYLFEREVLNKCKDKNMTKVVVPLSAGEIRLKNQLPPLDEVYFIVFERAENDLRQAFLNSPPDRWYCFFRAIKHTCIGLEQLHGDLGRVIDSDGESPFSQNYFAGDPNYAPIEIVLKVKVNSFNERYLADLNAVGSLIYQTLMGVQITGALTSEALHISPAIQRLDYHQALPVFETAFFTLMDRLHQECKARFDIEIANAVANTVTEMCHPNYKKRGAPKANNTRARANMRRYTSKINGILRLLKIKGFV